MNKFIVEEKHSCLRCQDLREVWVWKDTSETEKVKVDCPMCTVQRPPQELRDLGII
jgi:Zn finger protein HypA/HybF involved in hydrogenase expression